MSRGNIAFAIVIASISFSEFARADDEGSYWTAPTAVDLQPPPKPPRVEYIPTHAPPFEPPAARFGARGQVALLGGTSVGLSYTSYGGSNARYFSASFVPALDYFIVENFSIGLQLSAGYSDNGGYGADSSFINVRSSHLLVGPRVSYNIAIGRSVSFYPSASFDFGYTRSDETLESGGSLSIPNAVASPSTTEADAQINVAARLYFHPRSHVLIGFGPSFSHDFARVQGGPDVGAQTTSFGFGVAVGGYWGGDRSTAHDDAHAPARRSLRAFGDAHEIVVTNELLTNGSWTTHAGTGSNGGNLQSLLAADYFLAQHFSIGAIVSGAYAVTNGVDPNNQAAVKTQTDSLGLGLRFGVQIPLVDTVSVYPRLTFSGGERDFDSTSIASENKNSILFANIAAYVPLVVEVAPHFIVGFGPSISHDLSAVDESGRPNPATTVGAAAEVGVWL